MLVFSGAELSVIAAARGDAARAGSLWGSVEAEARLGRVGQWEREREGLEALVLAVDGPQFAAGRAEGGLLTIIQAAGLRHVGAGCRRSSPAASVSPTPAARLSGSRRGSNP